MKFLHQRLILFTSFLFISLSLLWFLLPAYQTWIAGIGLGLVVSFYNVWFLSKKMRILDVRAALDPGSRHRGTGMIHRFCVLGIAIFLAARCPEWIDVRAIVFGVPLCYLFLFLSELLARPTHS